MALFIILLLIVDVQSKLLLVEGYEYSRGSFISDVVHPYNGHHPSSNQHFPRRISTHKRTSSPLNEGNQTDEALYLGGAGITLPDEKDPIVIRTLRSSPSLSSSTSALVPFNFIGLEKSPKISGPRKKKNCREPTVVRRIEDLPTKRAYFAYTQEEVDEKLKRDEFNQALERKKRSIEHHQLSNIRLKRSAEGNATDAQDLPWTCATRYEWMDMGDNSYPRFVRTAACTSRVCFNGFFRCRPRRYKTKVLKRIIPESDSCEEDVSLPEQLRESWKFQTITINLCCDCSGRMPVTG